MVNISRSARKTKIVCTLGPATTTPEVLERIVKAGMNVARFNLSHGSFEEHSDRIKTVRDISKKLDIPVAILLDLPGPKYRTGKQNPDCINLETGQEFTLTTRSIIGNQHEVSVNLPNLPQEVHPGDTVLVNDGAIELRALSTGGDDVKTMVVAGGVLTEGRGVLVPGMPMSGVFLTDNLRKNIDWAVTEKPDFIALSFVQKPEDINQVKEVLRSKNADIPICSKIERGVAIEHFDEILEATDTVMVARGDMGVDIPIQRVPIVQKELIRKCNRAGKAVITATQMLESMQTTARPTRAEVTDIANAIFDGTDAVMLSGETTIGQFPVESVKMMADTAVEAEKRCLMPNGLSAGASGSGRRPTTLSAITPAIPPSVSAPSLLSPLRSPEAPPSAFPSSVRACPSSPSPRVMRYPDGWYSTGTSRRLTWDSPKTPRNW